MGTWHTPAVACLLAATLAALGGCGNTLVFAERTKAAIAVDLGSNPAEPIELTVGYKRTVIAYVPPKGQGVAGQGEDLKGEALSLISNFDLSYASDSAQNPGGLRVRNAFASGKAARTLATNPDAVAALLSATYVKDDAGDRLRSFWKPDGTNIDKDNEDWLKAWMKKNNIDTFISTFLRAEEFAKARQHAIVDLTL